jgi:hypothetical protein
LSATLERSKDDKPDAPMETRLDGMRKIWSPDWIEDVSQGTYDILRDQYMPELPPVECYGHIINYLFEIGPTVAAGMGAGPLTQEAIDAWCRRIGVDLSPRESRWIVQLSREYLSEGYAASKHFAPPPWWPDGVDPPMTAEEAKINRQKAMARG